MQDAEDDDSSAGDGVQDQPVGGEPMKEDFREDHVARDEIPRLQPEYFDGFPQDYDSRKKELAGRRMPFMKSSPANIPDEDEKMFFLPEEPTEYSGSRGQNPRSHSGNFSSSREERYSILLLPKSNLRMYTSICMPVVSSPLYFVVLAYFFHLIGILKSVNGG